MQYEKYDMAVKLVRTGASCRGINYDHLRLNPNAIELLKLFYKLSIYMVIAEGDIIYDWARSLPVKVLESLKHWQRSSVNEVIHEDNVRP